VIRHSVLAVLLAASGVADASLAADTDAATKPTAGARVELSALHDRIDADGVLTRDQIARVRILDSSGLAAFAQVGVPFLESTQTAELTELAIEKPDGRKTDLLPTAPRDVAPFYPPTLPIYSDLRVLRAAVSQLEVGDRLSYTIRVIARPLVEGQVWTEASFGDPESADEQVYELDVPAGSRLTLHARADLGVVPEEEHTGGRWVRRWRMRPAADVAAALKRARAKNPTPDIEVTSFASWQDFGRWWFSLAPPEADAAVRAKAAELVAGRTDPLDKLRALHGFVAREIRYLALPLGLGRYQARSPADVLRSGLGDCKDKSRLLASLALAAGLEVEPVLLNASGRGFTAEVPSPLQFDHVVERARVGGHEVWMDATSEMTPMGRLPRGARGRNALAWSGDARHGTAALITTPDLPRAESVERSDTSGTIDVNGLIHVKVRWTISGDDELWRLAFKYGSAEQQKQAVQALQREWGDKAKFGAQRHSDPEDLSTPFWVEYEVDWPMSASVWNKAWTFWVPVPRTTLAEPPDATKETGASETTPDELDFESTEHQIRTARIEVPEGVKVTPPVPVTLERSFADFRSDYRVEGRTLVLERELTPKVESVAKSQFLELAAFAEQIERDREQEFDFAAAPEVVPAGAESADELSSRCYDEIEEKRYQEAEKLCRRAVELEPEHKWAWNNLGRALRGLERPKEAEEAFRRQLEINPNDSYSYANLGRLARDAGKLDEAERLMRKQVEVAPLEPFGYQELGHLLFREQKLEEAETVLQRALKLDPEDEWTQQELLRLSASLGRCSDLLAGLAAHPDIVRDLTERISLASAMLFSGCQPLAPLAVWFETMKADVERELTSADLEHVGPDKLLDVMGLAAAWDAEGRLALERGDAAAADRWLAAALELFPSPETAAARARALSALHDADGAGLHWGIAVALSGPHQEEMRKRFEKAVPAAAERARFEDRAAEASWRLRTVTRKIPAAAGAKGKVWMLFDRDGRMTTARSDDDVKLPALMSGLGPNLSMKVPDGNRARIPRHADVYCTKAGDCTFLFEYPAQTAWSAAQHP
jgi:tetratricopeptide (TPR) repeat protein/transglutaminase-like putative cysteine protease